MEHNLNAAIYFSAAAINFVITKMYKGTGCKGSTGDDGPIVDVGQGVPADTSTELKAKIDTKRITEFFSVGGIISSLLALGLVSIFEKLKSGAPLNLPGIGRIPITP